MQWRQNKEIYYYSFILFLTGLRVLTSKVRACPEHFDCESYLAMAGDLVYVGHDIPGHHAMRIVPTMLVRGLHALGFEFSMAFQILSGGAYCLLGVLLYWILKREQLSSRVALAFTLLCLAPHHAMRIPLQLVYQSCDMLTYPLTLWILYCSFKRSAYAIFGWSVLGIFVRQNLFILGELSLFYCFSKITKWHKRASIAMLMLLLASVYIAWQRYCQAFGIMAELLHPPAGYFTASHFWMIAKDSKIYELFVPIVPFLIVQRRRLIQFFMQYWHVVLYAGIVVGQPWVGYHLTGNNFQRLALQGVWVIFLSLAFSWPRQSSPKAEKMLLLYTMAVYFIWSIRTRMLMALLWMFLRGKSGALYSSSMREIIN